MIILIEGIEGTGKSELAKSLNESIPGSVYLKEPCDGVVGNMVRNVMNHSGDVPNITSQLFLFEAARAELYGFINKNKPDTIIMDRGFVSTLVYQGFLGGINLDTIRAMNKLATQGTLPDIKILLVANPYVAKERVRVSRKRTSDFTYLSKAQTSFLKIAQDEGDWFIFDAEKSKNLVFTEVMNVIISNGIPNERFQKIYREPSEWKVVIADRIKKTRQEIVGV